MKLTCVNCDSELEAFEADLYEGVFYIMVDPNCPKCTEEKTQIAYDDGWEAGNYAAFNEE